MGVIKTDSFKEHVQAIVEQSIGVKISKEKAWGLFKSVINGTVQFVLMQNDNRLPLAGVGNFEILKTKPRKSKAGLDKDGNLDSKLKVWPYVPRFRFYPSVAIDNKVEFFFGLGEHEEVKMEDYGSFKKVDPQVDPSSVKPKSVVTAKPKTQPVVAKAESVATPTVEKVVAKDAFDDEM